MNRLLTALLLALFTFSFADSREIYLIGHRGIGGKSYENTWKAFRRAIKSGLTSLETDVQITRDGYYVLLHDRHLRCQKKKKPYRRKRMNISQLNLAELFNCPGRKKNMMTLHEFFDQITGLEEKRKKGSPIVFTLDVKTVEKRKSKNRWAARCLLDMIHKFKLRKRVIVQSANLKFIREFKRIDKTVFTSALFQPRWHHSVYIKRGKRKQLNRLLLKKAQKAKADGVSLPRYYVSREIVSLSKKKGLRVIVFTLNSKKQILHYLNMGVDGILTDKPKLLARTFKKWKKQPDKS